MRLGKIALLLLALALPPSSVAWAQAYGPAGLEGESGRRQAWLVPSADPAIAARAWLYRPPGDGPFRLAVIAHASTQNALRRAQMADPDYPALAAFLVARGFAVLVPERLGHGRTGGRYQEDQGGCAQADYLGAAGATARQIALALDFLRGQAFIRKAGSVIIGHSAGGWGALALAGENPEKISSIAVFAAGRGGHADDAAGQVCAPQRLLAAAHVLGEHARVPVTWLVAANDSYFPPALSRRLADAFHGAGGKVNFVVLLASGGEGHWLVEHDDGVALAAEALDRALRPGAIADRNDKASKPR
jgi:pimeloyl-ACP methyl ester carboxylesterase